MHGSSMVVCVSRLHARSVQGDVSPVLTALPVVVLDRRCAPCLGLCAQLPQHHLQTPATVAAVNALTLAACPALAVHADHCCAAACLHSV
jgi:hypothetical protein